MRQMTKGWFLILGLALAFSSPLRAQDGTVGLDDNGLPRGAQRLDEGVKFTPHWSGELAFTRSSQPVGGGVGQTQTDLAFTATDNLDADGAYLSLGAEAGSQKVEGAQSPFGALALSGGLVLGDFSPSLTLSSQSGDSQWRTYSGSLSLDFTLGPDFTLGLLLGGGFQGHLGKGAAGTINTKNWTAGLNLAYQAFEDLGFDLSFQRQTDITYKTGSTDMDAQDRVSSISLGFDWGFTKHFALQGTAQYGREYFPSGSFYSPILGETLAHPGSPQQDFEGYSLALVWDFDFGK